MTDKWNRWSIIQNWRRYNLYLYFLFLKKEDFELCRIPNRLDLETDPFLFPAYYSTNRPLVLRQRVPTTEAFFSELSQSSASFPTFNLIPRSLHQFRTSKPEKSRFSFIEGLGSFQTLFDPPPKIGTVSVWGSSMSNLISSFSSTTLELLDQCKIILLSLQQSYFTIKF